MNRMQHTRPCASCGKMMYNVGNRKWRASGTRTEQRHRALWKANAEGRHDALLADVRAAEQAGLSYGKYMLTKNKKPAGAETPTSCKG